MTTLTRDDLVAIAPRPKRGQSANVWDGYAEALLSERGRKLLSAYQVNTRLRLCHALATMAAETGFRVLWESGAYSPDRIVQVFGPGRHSAAIGAAEARRIAGNAQALFERVYGLGNPKKAKALGNTEPGDGHRFRGLGLVQMTGRAAHTRAAEKIGCGLADLEQPINCLHAFLIEWGEINGNLYADRDDAVSIRKLINGGSLKVPISRINGLPEAQAALKRAKAAIDDDPLGSTEPPALAGSEHKPGALPVSTEVQASVFTFGSGGFTAQDSLAQAAAKTAASGDFSWQSFLFNLASDPQFWLGAGLIGAGVYLLLKRRARFYIYGV